MLGALARDVVWAWTCFSTFQTSWLLILVGVGVEKLEIFFLIFLELDGSRMKDFGMGVSAFISLNSHADGRRRGKTS